MLDRARELGGRLDAQGRHLATLDLGRPLLEGVGGVAGKRLLLDGPCQASLRMRWMCRRVRGARPPSLPSRGPLVTMQDRCRTFLRACPRAGTVLLFAAAGNGKDEDDDPDHDG